MKRLAVKQTTNSKRGPKPKPRASTLDELREHVRAEALRRYEATWGSWTAADAMALDYGGVIEAHRAGWAGKGEHDEAIKAWKAIDRMQAKCVDLASRLEKLDPRARSFPIDELIEFAPRLASAIEATRGKVSTMGDREFFSKPPSRTTFLRDHVYPHVRALGKNDVQDVPASTLAILTLLSGAFFPGDARRSDTPARVIELEAAEVRKAIASMQATLRGIADAIHGPKGGEIPPPKRPRKN